MVHFYSCYMWVSDNLLYFVVNRNFSKNKKVNTVRNWNRSIWQTRIIYGWFKLNLNSNWPRLCLRLFYKWKCISFAATNFQYWHLQRMDSLRLHDTFHSALLRSQDPNLRQNAYFCRCSNMFNFDNNCNLWYNLHE